ncbi:MAG: TolC family protein [Pontiellaceae bacterium]|nr:TolC family protein [Pontiellaceae bacterium]MBN2784791.1 TolC family protein [Pontiellaceae bacterium]
MKTISQKDFFNFLAGALPELMASVMREDQSAVTKGKISITQFWAMHYISLDRKLSVNALTEKLNRSESSTSALLNRLETAGMIRRERSTEDQRVVNVSLTAKGHNMIRKLEKNRKQGICKTYSVLNTEERTRYQKIMTEVLDFTRAGQIAMALFLLFSCRIAHAQETNRYTLNDSVRLGLHQSLSVINAARQRQVAATTQDRAMAGAFPQLSGMADYALYDADNLTESGSKTMGLEASWTVFSGGKTLSAIRAARSYQQLAVHQERRIRETHVRDIILSYYQVQLAGTRVTVLEQSIRQLEDFEAETQRKYDAGTASEFDWLSAKVSLANEKPRLISARNDLQLAKEQFRNLTYLKDSEFILTDPLEYVPNNLALEEAVALGLSRRPELKEKADSVELRQEDINQQKSSYYPAISLFANYNMYDPDPYSFLPGSTSSGWQEHWSAGARATWTLFDGGLRKANLSESQLMLAIEEDELLDMNRTVALDIRTQWLRSRDAAETIRATDENIALAERALEIARTRFDAGMGTHLEVTQANVELSNARLTRSQALYEYMVAVTRIKHAAGILLEEYEDEK